MEELFSEFRDISFKEWKNKANFDLDGKDFNDNLNWHTLEGINIPPYFSPDQKLKTIDHSRKSSNKLSVAKYFILENDKRSLNIFNAFISEEFDTVKLFVPRDFNLSQIINIRGLYLKNIQFEFEFFNETYISSVLELSENLKGNNKIFLNLDLIGRLVVEGNWLYSEEKDVELLNKVSRLGDNIIPFSIDTTYYHNSGANIVQQISYALSTAVEYADIIGSDFFNKVQYNFAIGSNFFFEIAKISVFDYLINLVKGKYKVDNDNIICCESSIRNKTIYDAHTNLLRSTTEAISAILSNVDTFISSSFDYTYNRANKFSSRIGYNQLLILKEEAYLDKVDNIGEGSYYLDFIKFELAEKSLEIFKLIENGGGILKQIKEGVIQRKINDGARKEQLLFDEEFVYKNVSKEMMNDSIRKYPFLKYKNKETIFNVIYPKRLSEAMEKQRLDDEK